MRTWFSLSGSLWNGGELMSDGKYVSSVLQICFIILKILNLISWNWLLVLLPTFLYVSLFMLYILIIAFTGSPEQKFTIYIKYGIRFK